MAAPVFEGASFNGGSGTSRVVNVPAGTTDGDQLLLIASCDLGASQNVTFSVSSAWDELLPLTRSSVSAAGANLQVWTKVADSEPSSYTVTLSTSRGAIAAIVRVSGQDLEDAFDAISIVPFSDGTEAKIPSITTETNDCLVIGLSSWDESKTWNGVAPAGWSVGYNADHTTVGVSHDQAGVYKTQATAGATGVGQLELSAASPHVSAAIAIRPPQGSEPDPVEIDLGVVAETSTVNPLVDLSPSTGELKLIAESGTVNPLVDLSPELITLGLVFENGTANELSAEAPPLEATLGLVAETGAPQKLVDDSPAPPRLMLIGSGSVQNASTSVTPPAVEGAKAGDVGYIWLISKNPNAGTQPSAPSGWGTVVNAVVGTGTPGNNNGPMRIQVFKRVAQSDDEFDSMPTITRGGDTGAAMAAAAQVWRNTAGGEIEEATSSGTSFATDGNFLATLTPQIQFAADEDVLVTLGATTNTLSIPPSFSSASGVTLTQFVNDGANLNSNQGHQFESLLRTYEAAGAVTTNVVLSGTQFGQPSTGGAVAMRLRGAEPDFDAIDLGLVTESGTPPALSGRSSGSLAGAITEAGTAQPLSGRLSATLGLVTETGTVNPMGIPIILGAITEAGDLNPLGGRLVGEIGIASEAGTTHALAGWAAGSLGSISETSALFPLGGVAPGVLGLIVESGTPNLLAGRLTGTLGVTAETGTSLALSGHAAGALGLILETGTPGVVIGRASGALGMAAESGAALALSGTAAGTLGLAAEASSLHALAGQAAGSIGIVTGSSTAFPVFGQSPAFLGLITETSELYRIRGAGPPIVLGLVLESGELAAVEGVLHGVLGSAVETSRLLSLVREYPYVLPQKVLKVVVNARALRLKIPRTPWS